MKLLAGVACLFLFGPLVVAATVPIEQGFFDYSCVEGEFGRNLVARFETGVVNGFFESFGSFYPCDRTFRSNDAYVSISGSDDPFPDPIPRGTWGVNTPCAWPGEKLSCSWSVTAVFGGVFPSPAGREHGDIITVTGPFSVEAHFGRLVDAAFQDVKGVGRGTGTIQLMVWAPGANFEILSAHGEFTAVPEPATTATTLLGFAGLGALALRRSNH